MGEKSLQTVRKSFSVGFYFCIFLLAIFVDQVIKFFVTDHFKNYYFAFSAPVPQVVMYLVYGTALTILAVYMYRSFLTFDIPRKLAWTFIGAGAVSNVAERIVLGYVKDFISIFGGILNVADFYILGGVFILLLLDFSPRFRKNL